MEKKRSKAISKNVMITYLPLLALVVVIIVFAILSHGRTLKLSNIMSILLQSCTYILAGLGILFTMSLGNMDMSLNGIICLAGAMGLLAAEASGSWVMFPVVMVIAIVAEMLIGVINIVLGVNSIIGSFAVAFMGTGFANYIFGRRTRGLSLPSVFSGLYSRALFYIVTITAIILIAVLFHYTKLGKWNMAIGSNPNAAKASGIPVNRYKLSAYLTAGIMMGLTTLLILIRAGSAGATLGAGFHVNLLLMMVIGGASLTGGTKEKVLSVIVGVFMLLLLENGLTVLGVDPNMIGLIEGIIFLISVTLTFDRDGVPYIL